MEQQMEQKIQYIPDHLKTEAVVLAAVKISPFSLKWGSETVLETLLDVSNPSEIDSDSNEKTKFAKLLEYLNNVNNTTNNTTHETTFSNADDDDDDDDDTYSCPTPYAIELCESCHTDLKYGKCPSRFCPSK